MAKPHAESRVLEWMGAQREERLYLSVLTLGELARGIHRLPAGRKKNELDAWLRRELRPRFAGRWLPVDDEIAERWGLISAEASRAGLTLPVTDGLLAATALVRGMTYVSRNDADVRRTGVLILNPWRGDS